MHINAGWISLQSKMHVFKAKAFNDTVNQQLRCPIIIRANAETHTFQYIGLHMDIKKGSYEIQVGNNEVLCPRISTIDCSAI